MPLPLVLSLIAFTAASPILSAPVTLDATPPDDPKPTRTVYNIVWSCLTTVFACTWIAVHPNIPSPHDSQTRIMLRRVRIMLVAIMVPEYIAVWALRQWLFARRITKELRAMSGSPPTWTITHSFFLIMGGFMLVDKSGVPKGTLTYWSIRQLKEMNLIAFPCITEKEIQDKSKGDALSKAILLLQTSWFLLQVVARATRNLPITELELVTIAFASLNLFAYGFWWKKPLNVGFPVEVRLLLPSAPAVVPDTSPPPQVEGTQPNKSSPLTMDITSVPLFAEPDFYAESDLTSLPDVPSFSARENVSTMPFAIVENSLWDDSFPPSCSSIQDLNSSNKDEFDWLCAVIEPSTAYPCTDDFFPLTADFTPYWLPPVSEPVADRSDPTGLPSLTHVENESPHGSLALPSESTTRRNSVDTTSHFSTESSTTTASASDSQPMKRNERRSFPRSWCHHLFSRVTHFLHVLRVILFDFARDKVFSQIMSPGRGRAEMRSSATSPSSSDAQLGPFQSSDILSGRLRVDTFGGIGQLSKVVFGTVQLLISLYLGAIHCVAWSFPYPSVETQWLWRTSTLLLTCVPGYFLILALLIWGSRLNLERYGLCEWQPNWVARICRALILAYLRPRFIFILKYFHLLLYYSYFVARTILIVLPFVLLGNLTSETLLEVEWTTFIPHI